MGTGKEICAKDIGDAFVINQIFAKSPHNVRLNAVAELHAQNNGHTSVEEKESHTRGP